MIYTFYSYKGGVGRSMALANAGELLYRAGLRVLMVDWDLEAPGLERYFPAQTAAALARPGLMDLLVDYKARMSRDLAEESAEASPFVPPSPDYNLVDLYPDIPSAGRLYLLSAGRRAGDFFTEYGRTVRSFDWQDFYEHWEGELYFEWLRRQFEDLADVTLIDSRTGVTEMGGVSTYQLADVVVMFCAGNQQNIDGTYDMARNFTRPLVQEIRPDRPLQVIVVPARVEDRAESALLNAFRDDLQARFGAAAPEALRVAGNGLWERKIPYVPFYAFTEVVAVREPDSAHNDNLVPAFVTLTAALANLAPQPSALPAAGTRLQRALVKGAPLTVADLTTAVEPEAPPTTDPGATSAPAHALSVVQHQQLEQTLCSAFPTLAALDRVVQAGLGRPLTAIAGDTPSLRAAAAAVLAWAEHEQRVEDLVVAAVTANPDHTILRVMARQIGPAARAAALRAAPHEAMIVDLPFVVAALTTAEAADLGAGTAFTRPGATPNDQRRWDDLIAALHRAGLPRPLVDYGSRRDTWRPFGSGPTAADLIRELVDRANGVRGVVPGLPLISHRILSAEFFGDDPKGQVEAWEQFSQAGGVVILDGISLFHPRIRQTLLASGVANNEGVAVMTVLPVGLTAMTANRLVAEAFAGAWPARVARFAPEYDALTDLRIADLPTLQRALLAVLPPVAAVAAHTRPRPTNRQALARVLGPARGLGQAIFGRVESE